jgi:F420-dependent oxidoreductase-like protein
MRLRVLLEPRYGASYDQILALALATEEAGFDAFFRSDHYLGIEPNEPALRPTDSWTTLAGLAIQTSRVTLGTLMTAGTFRQPGQLGIEVATVDAMSGGRVELGIGTGWYEREHHAFGIPFPPVGERFDRLEEALTVITGLWSTPPGDGFSFAGKHFQLDECANFPATARDLAGTPGPRRGPRIIIGGGGPRRTPELAARFADEFNTGLGLGAGLPERFAYFRRVVAEHGRDPAAIRLSTTLPVCCAATRAEAERHQEFLGAAGARLLSAGVVGVPGDVLGRLEQLTEAGLDTVYFHIYDVDYLDQVRLLGQEVVPHAGR